MNLQHSFQRNPQPIFPAATIELPRPIPQDWHPHLGERLAVFPRHIAYRGMAASPGGEARHARCCYWPDLATFVEDEDLRCMMYAAAQPSDYSLVVVYRKRSRCWELLKFRDDVLVRRAGGSSFAEAMLSALSGGLEPAESLP